MIAVLGPWSSGTSALAAAVAALGANAHPPFVELNDPKTPVSYESRELRRIVLDHFDEAAVRRTGKPAFLVPRLRVWAGPGVSVAKLPQLAFFLPEMQRAWDLKVLISERPIDEIEASRRRRGWPAEYGRKGAARIGEALAGLPREVAALRVDHADLRRDPVRVARRVADFAGLDTPKGLAARLARTVRSGD